MPELDKKAASVFAGKVVRKDLVRKVKVGANVPVFVLEYLLGKYCATDDPVAIEAGLKVVNNTLASNFVRPDEANKAQSMLKDKGKHTFIDKVQVRYISDDDKHWAELKNFGHKYVHIPEHFLREYDRLLMGGIWAPSAPRRCHRPPCPHRPCAAPLPPCSLAAASSSGRVPRGCACAPA